MKSIFRLLLKVVAKKHLKALLKQIADELITRFKKSPNKFDDHLIPLLEEIRKELDEL